MSDLVLARNCCLARMLPGEGPYAIGIQNTHQVRYLLQLLAAVVCAANCRRIVCAVIQQSSHGVCGSINNRRRRLYRRRSSGQQKLHGVCLALEIFVRPMGVCILLHTTSLVIWSLYEICQMCW